MPSQFFGLNIAYTGLLASNAALNTTSNNIANVQTNGYSRQQVVQQASDALRIFQTYGCAGAGVDTLAIERIRDEFYDRKFWNANTSLGEYEIKDYYMDQLQTYFADDGVSTGFKTIFDQFTVNGLQEVLKASDVTAAKKQYIGYGENLTEYFNGMWGSLQKVQKDVNQELKLRVDEINSIAGEIAALNKQINVIELSGPKANELRDRRTLLLDELSKIVDIETQEIPVVDANNPERETGAHRFLVKIGGGQLLVNDSDYKQLECIARPIYEKVNQTDIDGLYDIYWTNGEKFNMYGRNLGGTLQGLVEMRDGNNSEQFTGTITGTGTKDVEDRDGNMVSHDTVTVKVSREYLQDLNKCNLSDTGGVINLGNQLYYYDSWSYTFDYDESREPIYSYTFVLSDSELNDRKLTNDRVGKQASIGKSIDYQGIPYYMKQMNEWVRTYTQKFNDIISSGYNAYNQQGPIMFTGKKNTSNEQYTFDVRYDRPEDKKKDVIVDVTDNSYYKLTAENFSVLAALFEDADLLATEKKAIEDEPNKTESVGKAQYDILTEIKVMSYDKTKMSFRGSNASEFLQCVLSDVALNAGNAKTFCSNYTNISKSVDNQRISISGVDEDEEAINLVKYQNGYNLASKMIQTLTEVYDRLILETGV